MISQRSKFVNGCKLHPKSKIIYIKNSKNPSCEICNEVRRAKKQSLFIKRSKKIHKNKYSYSEVTYKRSDEKVIIICPIHGRFSQMPYNHVRGQGCDDCLNESLMCSQDEIIEKFKIVHDNTYDYSKVKYINWKLKIIIKCKKHGDFSQSAGKHFSGQGCPKCKMSHGERKIEQFLIKNNLQYYNQHTFEDCIVPGTKTRLRFDFYIPELNLGIEYDGEQHFNPRNFGNITKNQAKKNLTRVLYLDELKNDYIKKNNKFLIRISFKKLKEIENLLYLSFNKIKNGINSEKIFIY